jgi:hypothetical protein
MVSRKQLLCSRGIVMIPHIVAGSAVSSLTGFKKKMKRNFRLGSNTP